MSAGKLYEIIKELPSSDIELISGEKIGRRSRRERASSKSSVLPSTDYPALPSIEREGLTPLTGAGVLELIRKTLFAAGDNDARYILNGLLVTLNTTEKKTLLRLVGTDGHRLAVAEQEVGKPGAKEAPTRNQGHYSQESGPGDAAAAGRGSGDAEPLIGFTKNLMIFRKSGLPADLPIDGRQLSELSTGRSQREQQEDSRERANWKAPSGACRSCRGTRRMPSR